MPDYYPVYLQLKDRLCVVVGGGEIAEGKVTGLLAAGARITVIAPKLTEPLRAYANADRITYIPRRYLPGDVQDAFMVICATNQHEINQQVWQEAEANHQLVNVVDDIPHCNFIAPSIVRQGDLTIAISTSGNAPVLAVRLKERLQREIGPHYAHFLRLAGKLRQPLAQHIPNFKTRKLIWYQLVDSDVLELLSLGNEQAAVQRISEIVGFQFRPDAEINHPADVRFRPP
jgi:siroheme synthase-like protein